MDCLTFWSAEDWTDRDSYEAMIAELGGPDLDEALMAARETGRQLEEALTPTQRELYLADSDAGVDVNALRESAATRVALLHGIAIGAALAVHTEEAPEKLVALSSNLMTDLLSSGLASGVAFEAMKTILTTLQRADRAAGLPRWEGEVREYALPERGRPDEGPASGTEELRPEGANEEMA